MEAKDGNAGLTVRVLTALFFLPTSSHPSSCACSSSAGFTGSLGCNDCAIDKSSSSSVSRKKPRNSSASSWWPPCKIL